MAHRDMDPAEARRQECAAFRAVANVLMANHSIWRSYRPVNFSLQRFCDKVDRLCDTGEYAPPIKEEPDPMTLENRRADQLLIILERMNGLVDFVEDPKGDYQHAAELVPARSKLPADDEGILAFCRAVHTSLLHVPGATTVRGGFAARMRNLNAALTLFADYYQKSPEEEQPKSTAPDYHDQRRDHCLHLLLVQVDACMHKFAEHIAFQDAYHEARMVVMRLTVQTRKTYFRGRKPWLFPEEA